MTVWCGQDVGTGAEVEMHIVLCLWGSRVQVYYDPCIPFQCLASQAFLLPIFRVFSTNNWHYAVNCAMITLMVLGWNDVVCTPVVQIWPLSLLVADAAASSTFCIMMAQGFELHNQVRWPASFYTSPAYKS